MPTIKYANVFAHRIRVPRNIEDWRNETAGNPAKQWAIHCLQHDHRAFFRKLSGARGRADMPEACPICQAFDQRCVYCPSDIDKWKLDPTTGFIASAGHISGDPVCLRHQYGRIPDGIDYLQVQDVVLGKPVVEIFLGAVFTGAKIITVRFQSGDQNYWIQSHLNSEYMSCTSAAEYHQGLSFALTVASRLHSTMEQSADSTQIPGRFETWEAAKARRAH
jgi:hypothetical protein